MADSSLQPSRCCKPKVKAQQFRVLQSMPMLYDVAEFLDSKPTGPLKLAMILSDKARQLLARVLATQICDKILLQKL